MAQTLKSYKALMTWPTTSLPYSVGIIFIIESLEQFYCSPIGLIFVKAHSY